MCRRQGANENEGLLGGPLDENTIKRLCGEKPKPSTSSTNTSAGIQWDSNGDCQLRAGLGSQGSPAQSPAEENLNRGKKKLVARRNWLRRSSGDWGKDSKSTCAQTCKQMFLFWDGEEERFLTRRVHFGFDSSATRVQCCYLG